MLILARTIWVVFPATRQQWLMRSIQAMLLHHELKVLDVSHNSLQDLLCKFYNGIPVVEEVSCV